MFEDSLFEELENILFPHYQLVRNKLKVTRVDSVPITIVDFEQLAKILPSFYKLELTDDKIRIIPVSLEDGMLFFIGMPTNVSFPC